MSIICSAPGFSLNMVCGTLKKHGTDEFYMQTRTKEEVLCNKKQTNSTKDLPILHFICDQSLISEYMDTFLNIKSI